MPSNGTHLSKGFGLPKENRLRGQEEFRRVRFQGRKISSINFSVYLLRNNFEHFRFGISIKKAIATAPRRNRVKRLIREFVRLNKSLLPKGYDFLILPKRDLADLKYQEVERELGELLIGKTG